MNATTTTGCGCACYAVWYNSVGCLPDGDGPEFVGTLAECKEFIAENAEYYERPEIDGDLYMLYVEHYG